MLPPPKTHDKLNIELIGSRDSTHHGYVMLSSRTDRHLIIVHRLSCYQAPMGVANEVCWHQRLFTFTGDVTGNQMPQTINWPAQALQILPHAVRASKVAAQVTAIMQDMAKDLPPVAVGGDPTMHDDIQTRYLMYVPGKYVPLLLAHCLTPPKEAFLAIRAEVRDRTK
jgi:hypothetical protein